MTDNQVIFFTIQTIGTLLSSIFLWLDEFKKEKVSLGTLVIGVVAGFFMWPLIIPAFICTYEFKNPFYKGKRP